MPANTGHLSLTMNLGQDHHPTVKDPVAQRGEGPCLRSHSHEWQVGIWDWAKWLVAFFHQTIFNKAMLIPGKETLTGTSGTRTVRQQWDFSRLNRKRLIAGADPALAKCLPSCTLFALPAARAPVSWLTTDRCQPQVAPICGFWLGVRLTSCLSGSPAPFRLVAYLGLTCPPSHPPPG